MNEGIDNLKEEAIGLQVDLIDFEGLKGSPVQNLVREWVQSAKNRVERNSFGHPFAPTSPKLLRKASLKLYKKCLQNEITKGCRAARICS